LGSKRPSRTRKYLFCLNLDADHTPPCASQLSNSGLVVPQHQRAQCRLACQFEYS
jgi:hypothetical protein